MRAPAVSAVHADIKAGPIIDLGHHGCAFIGLHGKICRRRAGSTDGGKCCADDKLLHVRFSDRAAHAVNGVVDGAAAAVVDTRIFFNSAVPTVSLDAMTFT